MSVHLLDRISGERVDVARRGIPALGRYQISPSPEQPVFLNDVLAGVGTHLVPDADGRFRLLSEDGEHTDGRFAGGQLLDDLGASSVESVGQIIEEALASGKSWVDWLDLSPLVPEMSKRVQMQDLERLLEKRLGHLEEICRRPRAHLRVEVERLSVSRARRFHSQAASFLAAHAEDWERPTLRAVVPKRILSLVREDELDIYENRVAVRLVDHLLAYLNRRIHEVASLLGLFQKAEDAKSYSESTEGSHWRQHRIYRLWGHAVDAHEGHEKAQRTLGRLRHLHHTVAGLMDSTLYRDIPPRAPVGTTLRMTNILANDAHYRRVAEIWLEWAQKGQLRAPRSRELFEARQRLCRGFSHYALLLVVRALEQLDFEPADIAETLHGDGQIALRVARGETWIHLELDRTSGTMMLRGERGPGLRIVPLAGSLATMDGTALRDFLGEVDASVTPDRITVVLYPTPPAGATHDRQSRALAHRLHALPHEIANGLRPRAGFLPVSPWDIGSVERVARLLRWTTLAPLFQSYPPRVRSPKDIPSDQGIAGWTEISGETLFVRRAPTDREWSALDLSQRVGEVERRVIDLEAERERVSDELRAELRGSGTTGELNSRKKHLHEQIVLAEKARDEWTRFGREMESARAIVVRLLECPTCHAVAEVRREFKPERDSRFTCACIRCKTTWETAACARCRRWIPLIRTTALEKVGSVERAPGWVDSVLGADVLAVPCPHGSAAAAFVCSECGACGCGVVQADVDGDLAA